MRKLKIATSITNRSLSNDVDKYKFIKSIATQLAKTRKEIDRIFDIGVTEFEIFKTKNTSEYVEKRKIWHIRQYLIENLQFGEQNIEKLIKINSKFKKQEIRIKKIADKLHLTLKKEKGKEVIDDFNFNSSFSVFSADKKCNAKYNVKKGDPFYTDLNYLLFRENIENSFYNDNWNKI